MEKLFDFADSMLVVLGFMFGRALLKVGLMIYREQGGVFAAWVAFTVAALALACVVVRIVEWVTTP
ncbi:MAG: hypothetical protein AB7Q81_24555 [Gammaproteobacteria bacterium]